MSYLPDFSDKDNTFIEGTLRENGAYIYKVETKESKSDTKTRILPKNERARIDTREEVLIKEDEDLLEWELVLRAYLYKLPKGRKHRVAAGLIWEWATGLSITEEYERGNSRAYLRDTKILNRLLAKYFGKSRITWINGRKFSKVYDVGKSFVLDRKAPVTLTHYLMWKQGATIR